jgi:UPF0271 protein
MSTIDINCDMGEGIGNDESIMPFISSTNISCGFHAGDEETMRQTIQSALKYHVAIGAHPSFFDKENFGRTEIFLPADEIYDLIILQLRSIEKILKTKNARLHHVKPHGALYNMSAKDPKIANAIALAVKDFDYSLVLYGLSGSYSITEAIAMDLIAANEVFADRSYQDDGSLTPRSQSRALLENSDEVIQQSLQLIKEKTVTTMSGKIIPVAADTICIHGDGEHAVEFAKAIHKKLKESDIVIQAF